MNGISIFIKEAQKNSLPKRGAHREPPVRTILSGVMEVVSLLRPQTGRGTSTAMGASGTPPRHRDPQGQDHSQPWDQGHPELWQPKLCPSRARRYRILIGFFFLSCLFVFFFLSICLFYLFIYLWLCWVFVSVRGISLVVASGGHSSSRCAGLSLSRPLLLRSTGSRRAGSVIVAHGPSCSAARGILPDQGLNPCPLHWEADSQPLRHQGSPIGIFKRMLLKKKKGCF